LFNLRSPGEARQVGQAFPPANRVKPGSFSVTPAVFAAGSFLNGGVRDVTNTAAESASVRPGQHAVGRSGTGPTEALLLE